MAWTTYEGQLTPTNHPAKTEADKDFGSDRVQDKLYDLLEQLGAGDATLSKTADEIWIQGSCWLRINKDGTIELGEAAA